jgi:hypothetical protein
MLVPMTSVPSTMALPTEYTSPSESRIAPLSASSATNPALVVNGWGSTVRLANTTSPAALSARPSTRHGSPGLHSGVVATCQRSVIAVAVRSNACTSPG